MPRPSACTRLLVAAVLCLAAAAGAARAETLVGSNVDSRLTLAFSVPAEAAQAWLPEGWTLAPFAGGPLAGANLLTVFVDGHLTLDAEGAPADPPLYRGVALVSRARRADETRIFVTRVYISDERVNPYGNSVAAGISRSRTLQAAGGDAASGIDQWSVRPRTGGEMAFRMSYEGAIPSWSEQEVRPYSNVDPDFFRIYRYRQLSDLVRSVPAGVDRASEAVFSSSIGELAPMFDGSERLIAIVDIPWYSRRLFLP